MHPILAEDGEILILGFGNAFLERRYVFGIGVSAERKAWCQVRIAKSFIHV